ncbi:MAG TPA: hypothetical protein VFH90_09690 [Candidatus Limnocylindria bacterium]|nr:hypothetical protein [Candidatus Limnocylindria bacterium]
MTAGGQDPAEEDDLVPVSVRLGQVVPPEDPEDWTRPLTWAAAAGMLLAPAVALIWYWIGPPLANHPAQPATSLLACALAIGAALTGATQQGALRAAAATLATALFSALAVIIVGALMAAERQVGTASPTVAHSFGAAVAGLGGVVAASPLVARLARTRARLPRIVGPGAIGAGVALLLVPVLLGTAIPVGR